MKRDYLILLIGVILLVALDQITKQAIASQLVLGEQIQIIDGFFSITSHRNKGGAWSIFYGEMTFFYIATLAAGVVFYFLSKDLNFSTKKLYSIALLLMIAGGIGNFIDRLLFQEVIDFLDFVIFGYDYPTFNVADICLVVGVSIFAYDVIKEEIFDKTKSNEGK